MKQKLLASVLAVLLGTGLTGCSATASATPGMSDKMQIVCTNFPEYDWVRQLTKGFESEYEITYLLDNGVDLHNYQPTAADMAKIAGCDLFVYIGGESEHWVPDALSEAINPDMQVIRLLDTVTAVEEEIAEGMECEEEEEDEEEEGPEYDEHVWLSLRNASVICGKMTDALCTLDSAHADGYRANLTAYRTELDALDKQFAEQAAASRQHTLIFGDRFPFRYFVEDYGYTYYAAFAGCSAETEASFETIAFLAKKVDETGADVIYTIEGGNTSIAEAVRSNTRSKDQKIASLNSLQSVTQAQIDAGTTYISLMEENLNVLKEDANVQ